MKKLLLPILILSFNLSFACSTYKVTAEGKTVLGCNEDAWRTTSRIWFENATTISEYGAAFTGSRKVSADRFAPQSGMNTCGLSFTRLTAAYPQIENSGEGKLKISNEVDYLSDILHKCADVNEVKMFIEKYDYSFFSEDVFLYVDSSGKYLIVEPYNIIEGDDEYYVLSNFCPSITNNESARKLGRFRNGEDFLKNNKIKTSLEFYTAMSDTMHVNRKRNGDGTLLTSIWNTETGLVNLYFYHNYDSTYQFNIVDELAKGDHIIDIASLFPVNQNFQRLIQYKTPFNTPILRILLVLFGALLCLLALLFSISIFKIRKTDASKSFLMLIPFFNVLLTAYFFVLATNIGVFYFDAPYVDYSSFLISISSYIPILLLVVIIPLLYSTINYFKKVQKKIWLKSILALNNLIYLVAIVGFSYWGLYELFV